MNRRSVLLVLGSCLAAPVSLFADAPDKKKPEQCCGCCKDCKCRESHGPQRGSSRGPQRGSSSRGRSYGGPQGRPPQGRGRSYGRPEGRPQPDMRGKHPHHRGGTHAHPQRGGICPCCKKPHQKGRR